LLALNTLPYRRIRTLNVAVWHSSTRLAVAARYYGDWGTQLQDSPRETDRTVPAHSVADLLRLLGWSQVHLIKCDIEGSEKSVFADPGVAWLRAVDAVAIETHDSIAPCSHATVAACFDPALFEYTRARSA
jgi:FkbM family methyltransferase